MRQSARRPPSLTPRRSTALTGYQLAAAPRPADAAIRAVAVGLADRRRRDVPRRHRPGHVLRRPDRRGPRWEVLAAGRKVRHAHGLGRRPRAVHPRLDKKKLWSTLPIVVVIDDGNGYRSIYAHFGKVVVKRGETVKAGQLLG